MEIGRGKNNNLSKNLICWPWYGFGLFLCFLFVLESSRQMWPPLDGDGTILFPPAVEISLGRDLKSPVWVWPLDESIDGPGGRRLVYHGFLYQTMVGKVAAAFGGGPSACIWTMHGFNLLTASICSLAVLAWIPLGIPWIRTLSFLMPIQTFAVLEAWTGRPEPLVILGLGMGLLAWKGLASVQAWIICSTLLPVLFFTSPAAGILALILMATLFLFFPNGKKLRSLGIFGLIAVAASGVLFSLYPYAFSDWFHGLRAHGKISFAVPPFQGLAVSWLKRPDFPLAALVLGIPFGLSLFELVRRTSKSSRVIKVLFGIFTLAGFFCLARFSLVKAEAVYNAAVFLPLGWALAWSHTSARGFAALLLMSGLPLVASLGWKSTILVERAKVGAVSFEELGKTISEKTAEGLVVSPAFYLACPNPWKVSFSDADDVQSGGAPWLIAKQANTGRASPQDLPGFALQENRFGVPLRIFGFPISNSPKGWEYALYKKN